MTTTANKTPTHLRAIEELNKSVREGKALQKLIRSPLLAIESRRKVAQAIYDNEVEQHIHMTAVRATSLIC